ncbi:L-2,4-diaminobutyrate decarboxylase [Enhygromyxa salina]|uniref:L-2,4-diaminobutyrate decarboxylase n=1 Tax=Enhygromyxa salina TaxID=215803 RepID=A0A2S9YBE5_9BACT|nr:aminotransferase class V-fold PLP-dependent enzyme [Enhygromyxa salina]PRQ02448.1 L-2,4-diaminobutyrate decarboxylase [Enhygromyxa salina]
MASPLDCNGNSAPLEPSAAQMQAIAAQISEVVIAHILSLGQQPASDTQGSAAPSLAEPLPRAGQPLDELLSLVMDELTPRSVNTASPGYLGYIPGGGLFLSAAAEFLAAAINRHVGVEHMAPGLVALEETAVQWLCEIVGYGPGAAGVLTTGGSLASLTALVAARDHTVADQISRGVVYASDQAHHSAAKAARMAGFSRANIRVVATDAAGRMDLHAAASMIAEDRRAGLIPAVLVASAGTTNTGAIDDLGGAAALAQDHQMWLHVDAAYGGFFMLTARGRERLAGLASAHSITLDPHKGLGLPYGNGALVVADRSWLLDAFSASADYLHEHESSSVNFCDLSPELSRNFRGLGLWLPLKALGSQPFAAHLDEKLDLADQAARALALLPGIEIVTPHQLSIVTFQLQLPRPAADRGNDSADSEVGLAQDELNTRLLAAINSRGRVYLSGTRFRGRFVLRLAVLSFRTHADRLAQALEDIEAAITEVSPR